MKWTQMLPFNPFSKDIRALQASDLSILRSVAEGWHVEYKSEFMPPKSIAKSVSAFANTYGGWLFYGIAESQDGTKFAASLPGVASKDIPALEMKLRDAVASHLSSAPFFDHTILLGPCQDLDLPDDRAILVIQIPIGQDPPYIHDDGRIYRRVGDKADPIPETDRSRLDLLWERSRQNRKRLADFVTALPEISESERNDSFVHLFVFCNLLEDQGFRSIITFDDFSAAMAGTKSEGFGIPFDNSYSMVNGYIARQAESNDPYYQTFTWRYHFDGKSIVTIPLSCCQVDHPFPALNHFLEGYIQSSPFLNVCNQKKLSKGTVIDLCNLFAILVGILTKLQSLLKQEHYAGRIFAKFHVENVWRRIPFIDLPAFSAFIANHGIPVIQDSNILVPFGTAPDSFVPIVLADPEPNMPFNVSALISAVGLFHSLATAFGLPAKAIGLAGEAETIGRAVAELFSPLLTRSIEVLRSRKRS